MWPTPTPTGRRPPALAIDEAMLVKHTAVRCIAVLGASALLSQGQELPTLVRVDVRLVEVYATVRDEQGRYLDNLSKEQIQVLEDGTPQDIVAFELPDTRLSCGILVDLTGSMERALPAVQSAVLRFIDLLRDQDRVAVYAFNESLRPVQGFTEDKGAAKAAVMALRAGGATALFDAIAGFSESVSAQPGKKAMIVFTDGADNQSKLSASAAAARAERSGVPIHTVAQGAALDNKDLIQVLARIAGSTGGVQYYARRASDVDSIFRDISADLNHAYLLAYKFPESANTGWRRIQLSVRLPEKVAIRTRKGYYPR